MINRRLAIKLLFNYGAKFTVASASTYIVGQVFDSDGNSAYGEKWRWTVIGFVPATSGGETSCMVYDSYTMPPYDCAVDCMGCTCLGCAGDTCGYGESVDQLHCMDIE